MQTHLNFNNLGEFMKRTALFFVAILLATSAFAQSQEQSQERSLERQQNKIAPAVPTLVALPPPPTPPFQTTVPAGFVKVDGGTFTMGEGASAHQVTVSSYYMDKYEVTQKEWVAVMGTNPSRWKGENLPVETVSWQDAVEYCNKRSVKESLTPAYHESGNGIVCDLKASGYRLPTEAEWEYAVKGGNKDFMAYEYAESNSVEAVGWHSGDSGNQTHPVGMKQANGLGLYDMSGNVWEWCWDWFGAYGTGTQTDPMGASSGSYRMLRGGGWIINGQYLRSALRLSLTPSSRNLNVGFRLLRPSL
jgi:formylglycine-generating enzyme required for sulfatase activity